MRKSWATGRYDYKPHSSHACACVTLHGELACMDGFAELGFTTTNSYVHAHTNSN